MPSQLQQLQPMWLMCLHRGAEEVFALCSGAGRSLGGYAYRWPWTPACAGVRHSPPQIVILNLVQENRLEPPRRHTRVAPCLTRGQAHFRPVWPPLLAGYDRTLRARQSFGHLAERERARKAQPRVKHGATGKGGDAENRPNRYRIFPAIAPKPSRLSASTPPHSSKTNTQIMQPVWLTILPIWGH